MISLLIENAGWEIKTTGEIEMGNMLRFTVRHPFKERIGFKCKVDVEISRQGKGFEIRLIHNKILPSVVKEAIQKMAYEILEESCASLELVASNVLPYKQRTKPFRRWA